MPKILRVGSKRKPKLSKREKLLTHDLNVRVAMIQELIPIALERVEEELNQEVTKLVGERYSRHEGRSGNYRWSQREGSMYLADQKIPVQFTRVRNVKEKHEVPLKTYELLQHPRKADQGVVLRILKGLSCRSYEVSSRGSAPSLWTFLLHDLPPFYQGKRREVQGTL